MHISKVNVDFNDSLVLFCFFFLRRQNKSEKQHIIKSVILRFLHFVLYFMSALTDIDNKHKRFVFSWLQLHHQPE